MDKCTALGTVQHPSHDLLVLVYQKGETETETTEKTLMTRAGAPSLKVEGSCLHYPR